MEQSQAGSSPRPHHRNLQGGTVRAGIFGLSDGLLTNVSLILGVAGAHPAPGIVRLAGLAGLVAGAFSMAAGEFVSMSAQSDLITRDLEVERMGLVDQPEEELRELTAMYMARGVDPETAHRVASQLMRNPELALETHAREELGISAASLGSPIRAAGASFIAFALGALIPLMPWFFASGIVAGSASIVLAAVATVGAGAMIARLAERPLVRGAVRQLAVSMAAAAVTYAVGTLAGGRIAG
ncbi:MAG: VIT1/CCC1 transporter family protein [Dehalococcoidia bacterium]